MHNWKLSALSNDFDTDSVELSPESGELYLERVGL